MPAFLASVPIQQFKDNNGNPLVGGLLYTYQAGTSIPQATYTDASGTIVNSNPVVLNARGEAAVWLLGGQFYKLILQDSLNVLIWSSDQVQGGFADAALLVNIASSDKLRSDFAAAAGAAIIGFTPSGLGAVPTTVKAALDIFSQKPSGQFFADSGAKVNRLADRLFIGEAIVSDGKLTNTVNSWLETMRPNSIRAAQAAITSTIGQGALVSGSRTSESTGAGSQGCIGISGYSNNNNINQIQSSYAGYFESRRQPGAGITQGIEVDIVNLGTTVGAYPNLLGPQGLSNALWVASGAGVAGATTASIAIAVLNNGADFEKGIIFQSNSLNTISGEGVAIAMGAAQGLVWYDTGVNKVARIRCDATAQSLGIVFANNTLTFQTMAGATLFAFGVDSSLTMTTGLKLAMPTLNFSGFTTASTASSGTAAALPANPLTYLQVQINGTNVKIPAYGV